MIIAIPAEISTPVRVASWIATVLLAIAAVNATAFLLRHGTRPRDPRKVPAPETTCFTRH